MKTNDEIVEEFKQVCPHTSPHCEEERCFGACSQDIYVDWLCTILTQKDDEVAEAVQKLRTEEPLYIGKTQYEFYKGDVRWVYNQALDDLITGLTPHPTDDTSDKIH